MLSPLIILFLAAAIILITVPSSSCGDSSSSFSSSATLTSRGGGSSLSEEISMGTTILAICYKDGVVVGADTRTSVSGYVSNRFAQKISPIILPPKSPMNNEDDTNIGNYWDGSTCVICRSGSAADTQYIADEVRWELESRRNIHNINPTISNAANLLRNIVIKNTLESTSLICAGYDHILQKGIIYTITPSGALLLENAEDKKDGSYAVGGSGSTYILGLLDDKSSEFNEMDETEAIEFVQHSIGLAMKRDGSSGGFVRTYVMNKNGLHKRSTAR